MTIYENKPIVCQIPDTEAGKGLGRDAVKPIFGELKRDLRDGSNIGILPLLIAGTGKPQLGEPRNGLPANRTSPCLVDIQVLFELSEAVPIEVSCFRGIHHSWDLSFLG